MTDRDPGNDAQRARSVLTRGELTTLAGTLYDLFKGKTIPCKVNGEDGRTVFFSKDAQIAQAKLFLQAAYDRGATDARAEDGLDVDAIYRVATGKLDRGTAEQRLEYIAETCQIIRARQEKRSGR